MNNNLQKQVRLIYQITSTGVHVFIWHFFHNKIGKYTIKNDNRTSLHVSKILREDIPIYLPLHTIAAIEHREEKTPRRRIVVTSSTVQMKYPRISWERRLKWRGEASEHIFKDDVNGFFSTSPICFMSSTDSSPPCPAWVCQYCFRWCPPLHRWLSSFSCPWDCPSVCRPVHRQIKMPSQPRR